MFTSPNTLVSNLPADPAFAPIIVEFVGHLARKLEAMREACRREDTVALASLGHWLKGTGPTLGFPALGITGAELETNARAGRVADCLRVVADIEDISRRIVVPESGSVA